MEVNNETLKAKKLHLHSWERTKGKNKVYRCTDPECTTYVRKDLQPITMLGKKCLCWNEECRAEHIVTRYDLQLAKILCERCKLREKRKREMPSGLTELEKLFASDIEKGKENQK